METTRRGWIRFLIPGFIFQSVMIGGGYGTGAEIAQFFGVYGMKGGLMGIVITLIVWSLLCALAFRFAHMFKAYDYGTLMRHLLGPAAFLYDICYYLMMLIVLGVLNATAFSMVSAMLGWNGWIGVAFLAVCIIFLHMKGTVVIENVLTFWSYILYAVYIVFLVAVFMRFGSNVAAEFAKAEVNPGWIGGGFKYSFYNLVVVPLVLYTVRDMRSDGEATFCGVLAGVIGIIPGVLLLLTMGCDMSAVVSAAAPVTVIFDVLNMRWLYILFEIVLFGTLIETGTGFVKAVSDRIEAALVRKERHISPGLHSSIGIVTTLLGVGISTFGLLGLIVKGYGTACWGFLILFAIPMVTVGVYKMCHAKKVGSD